jgi:hypothetical protein
MVCCWDKKCGWVDLVGYRLVKIQKKRRVKNSPKLEEER